MKKTKLSFSDFLIRKHGVSVLDFDETKMPDFWRRFKNVKAMAIGGTTIYIRDLDTIRERAKVELILHELRHIAHQRDLGWVRYLTKYTTPGYRCRDEISAYTVSMEHIYIRGWDICGYPAAIARTMRKNYLIGKWRAKWVKMRMTQNMHRIQRGKIHHVEDLMTQWKRA